MPYPAESNQNASDKATVLVGLSEAGLISNEEVLSVEKLVLESGALLDQVLSGLGLVTEEALTDFYATFYSIPRASNEIVVEQALTALANQRFLELHRVLPIAIENGIATAALVDPSEHQGQAGLAFALGAQIAPVLVTATQFNRLIASLSVQSSSTIVSNDIASMSDDTEKLKDLASTEPAVRLVNRLIIAASEDNASDIHIEPKERNVLIRRRIDGVLTTCDTLNKAQGLSAISRLKILANIDIAERRRPQDGRLSFPVSGRPIDMRVSTTPTIHGESVVVRLLEKPAATINLDALGFTPSKATILKNMIAQPNGILLLTGPTGSGKTTTLYSLLEELAKHELKILTIEDPVEYRIDGISQTQVNPAIGLTFASAMRSFLRHDPDVIMVGEMRDIETARTAIQAALTGHLVLSTLHTNDAPSALTRLLDMGIEDYLIASTLRGVVAQRLVRRVCQVCRNAPAQRHQCNACHTVGYAGRIALSEILEVSDSMKSKLRFGTTAAQLQAIAIAEGFEPMLFDGEEKIREGLTDLDEVTRLLGQ